MNHLRGKTTALNPAKIDLPHIWAVVQSWVRSLLPVPGHIREQIIWRRLEVIRKSPECWEKGNCIQCGCEMLGKTSADIECDNPPYCYPKMMSSKQWKKFKKETNIKLFN